MDIKHRQFWEEKAIAQYQTGKFEVYRADTDEWVTLRGIIENILRDHKDMNILDVGSGYGQVFNYLRKEIEGLDKRYKMIDVTPGMIEICEANTGIKPKLYPGDKLPFKKDKCFDLVISFSVLLYLPDNEVINHIQELVRVGKRVFIASYHNPDQIKPMKGFNYNHDYESIFEQLELTYTRFLTTLQGRVNYLIHGFEKDDVVIAKDGLTYTIADTYRLEGVGVAKLRPFSLEDYDNNDAFLQDVPLSELSLKWILYPAI